MSDVCKVKTVTVMVQENNIVRPVDFQGILGRLNDGTFENLVDESGDNKIKHAMDILKQDMKKDCEPGSYAHGWHCNIAMMCYDAMSSAGYTDHDQRHKVANDAASRFMKLCFDVETKN